MTRSSECRGLLCSRVALVVVLVSMPCAGHPPPAHRHDIGAAGASLDDYRLRGYADAVLDPLFSLERLYPDPTPVAAPRWLGSDVGATLPLPPSMVPGKAGAAGETTLLWLWGDTLIGQLLEDGHYRNWTTMPRNSVSLLTLSAGVGADATAPPLPTPSFHWGHYAGMDGPLFYPPKISPSKEFFWPATAVAVPSRQPILRLMAYHAVQNKSLPLFFYTKGTVMLTVHNPVSQPEHWNYSIMAVPHTDSCINWATSIVRPHTPDGFYYLFGRCRCLGKHGGLILARVAEADFEDPGSRLASLQMLLNSGWAASYPDYESLRILVRGDWQLSTAQFHPGMGLYYFLGIPYRNSSVYVIASPSLDGDWRQQLIYQVPQPWSRNDTYLVYSPNAHPAFERSNTQSPGELVFTYLTNTILPDGLRRDIDCYIPRWVRVNITQQRSAR